MVFLADSPGLDGCLSAVLSLHLCAVAAGVRRSAPVRRATVVSPLGSRIASDTRRFGPAGARADRRLLPWERFANPREPPRRRPGVALSHAAVAAPVRIRDTCAIGHRGSTPVLERSHGHGERLSR